MGQLGRWGIAGGWGGIAQRAVAGAHSWWARPEEPPMQTYWVEGSWACRATQAHIAAAASDLDEVGVRLKRLDVPVGRPSIAVLQVVPAEGRGTRAGWGCAGSQPTAAH